MLRVTTLLIVLLLAGAAYSHELGAEINSTGDLYNWLVSQYTDFPSPLVVDPQFYEDAFHSQALNGEVVLNGIPVSGHNSKIDKISYVHRPVSMGRYKVQVEIEVLMECLIPVEERPDDVAYRSVLIVLRPEGGEVFSVQGYTLILKDGEGAPAIPCGKEIVFPQNA